jgi:hypothetical protein
MGTHAETVRKWELFAEAYVLSGNGAEAAHAAGYKGKNNATLAVAGSRLLKKPEVKAMIAEIRKGIKTKPIPVDMEVVEHQRKTGQMRVDTEDKRALLWRVANICAEMRVDEDIQEEEQDDGSTLRIITRTERVFMPETTINAIDKLNVMDGDNKAPGGGNTSDLSIENLLLSIGR